MPAFLSTTYRPNPLPLPEDSEELVQLAITAYREGRANSLRQAATEHDAHRETVRRRFNGVLPHSQAHHSQQLLSPTDESTLKSWVLQYHAWGYPLRIDMLNDLAQTIRKRRYEDEHGIDSATPEMLPPIGANWYKRFLGRHKELSLIYSRRLDYTRAMNNNPKILQEFFALYKSVLEEFGITTNRTFNMDEKGFLLGLAKSSKIIIHSSKKYRFVTQDGNRETVTVLEAVSAAGFVCPPMVIFKGAYHQKGWYEDSDKVPGNWRFAVSPKGWTNNSLSLDWLEFCFDLPTRHLLKSRSDYRLLLLDGHESHVSWEFIEYCLAHKIIALCLPPHSTHLVQPLDVGLFSPYNHYYGRAVDDAVRQGNTGIGKPLFLQLFQQARTKTFQQRTIKNSFVESGLVPFSPLKVLRKLPNFQDSELASTPPPTTISQPQPQPDNSDKPPLTPRKSHDVQAHITEIFQVLDTVDDVPSPTRTRIQQLAKAVEIGIAENAILLNANTKLRNANRMRRKQDKRVLSKTRVLTAEEAQSLKHKMEEKEAEAARKKQKKKVTDSNLGQAQVQATPEVPPKRKSQKFPPAEDPVASVPTSNPNLSSGRSSGSGALGSGISAGSGTSGFEVGAAKEWGFINTFITDM